MRIHRLCLAAVLAALGSIACGDGGTIGQAQKVTATITFPNASVVGSQIEADVKVNNCDQVVQASLFDGSSLIRTFSMDSNPEPIILTTQDISFKQDGIAANLALTAQITCSDGRTGTSKPSGAQFLPVSEVHASTDGTKPVVPKFFFTEKLTNGGIAFTGCVKQSNGKALVQRFNSQGALLATIDRTDIQCDDTAIFTDPAGGYRWMLVPGNGAIAFDGNLHVTGLGVMPTGAYVNGKTIVVSPSDGSAIVWLPPDPNNQGQATKTVFRLAPNCLPPGCPNGDGATSAVMWEQELGTTQDSPIPFQLLADPLIIPSANLVLFAGYQKDLSNPQNQSITHHISYVNFTTGHELNGQPYGPKLEVDLASSKVDYAVGSTVKTELMAFNPQTTAVYLPFITQASPSYITEVRAYDDTTGQLNWTSPSFNEEIVQVVPYGNGTRLAAIAPNEVWLLNAADGTVLNPGHAIHAHGSFYILFVDSGPNEELYIQTGPAGTTANPVPIPGELITVQSAVDGELVRYQVGAGNLFARAADDGSLWMRVNTSLVKLFNANDYITLKSQ